MRVPALIVPSGEILTQSLAIIEYLDEVHREPPLLPADPVRRAEVRAVADVVACDIHPINNLCVLQYRKRTLGQTQETIDAWYVHWIVSGFEAIEALIGPDGPYAFGPQVTLADICIVPQMYNARRFNCDLAAYPTLRSICAHLESLPAFAQAAPEAQPDAA